MFTAGGIGDEPTRLGLRPLATLVTGLRGADPLTDDSGTGLVAVDVHADSSTRSGNGIVLQDGVHIVTSLQLLRDVTDASTSVVITDASGTSHGGALVARDEMNDLAIIRADGEALAPFPMGAAGALRTGSTVTGLGGGKGVGVRSWSNRVKRTSGPFRGDHVDLIGVATLDTALPAMAAGAAAIDAQGNVVGMISVDLRTGAATTAAYLPAAVVPIDRVLHAATQLLATGTIAHGWLGVEAPSPADTMLAVAMRTGATVTDVVAASPAALAGVVAGDILLQVCGHDVTSVDDVLAVMLITQPGTDCTIDVLRDGARWSTSAHIGARPPA
jgi:S1-C subfamily serine protease